MNNYPNDWEEVIAQHKIHIHQLVLEIKSLEGLISKCSLDLHEAEKKFFDSDNHVTDLSEKIIKQLGVIDYLEKHIKMQNEFIEELRDEKEEQNG